MFLPNRNFIRAITKFATNYTSYLLVSFSFGISILWIIPISWFITILLISHVGTKKSCQKANVSSRIGANINCSFLSSLLLLSLSWLLFGEITRLGLAYLRIPTSGFQRNIHVEADNTFWSNYSDLTRVFTPKGSWGFGKSPYFREIQVGEI